MAKGFVIALLALLATATARPEPQFVYPGPYYQTALSAAYTAPTASIASVVPAAVAAPAVPVYPSIYPSTMTAYAYGYQSSYAEVPVVNPSANQIYNSALTSLLPYSNLPYTYAPAAPFVDYLK